MFKKFWVLINILFFSLLFSFVFFAEDTYASTVLFDDDFESGLGKWTVLSGAGLWQLKEINGSMWFGARINGPSTIIDAVAGDTSWTDYEFEMDIYPVEGVDRNIRTRWTPERQFCNQFHLNPRIHMDYIDPNVDYNMTNNVVHHVRVALVNNNYKLYIDNQLLVDNTITNQVPPCLNGSIGLTVSTGAAFPTEVWIDNVVVRSLGEAPTPTPTPINLNVPSLKQTSSPWGSQLYDNAISWARRSSRTISSWGCALTSATMILNYYGLNLLPSGTTLDPGSLNTWLKSQADGYIGNGFVNWLAISRLSKLAKSINGITDFDALEYERKWTSDLEVLKNDIKDLKPDIVEEPGHFVVARGIDDDVININDPYFDRQTLADYSNIFLSLGTYNPTSTDLSYIMLVTGPDVTINSKDESLNNVGESFIKQAMVNDINPNEANSPIKILYIPKPEKQNYELSLSSSNNQLNSFKTYLYNKDGTVRILDGKALLGLNANNYKLFFNKENLLASTLERKITIDGFIKDVTQFRNLKMVQKDFAKELIYFAGKIKEDLKIRDKKMAKSELKFLQEMLKKSPTILIKKEAKDFLVSDISYLLKAL